MVIAALFKCVTNSAGEWINKTWYVHTMEYCLSMKQNEVLIHAATEMNLKDIMLNEISQTEKD